MVSKEPVLHQHGVENKKEVSRTTRGSVKPRFNSKVVRHNECLILPSQLHCVALDFFVVVINSKKSLFEVRN